MSERFYEDFTDLFFRFLLLLLFIVGASNSIVLYSFTENAIYYYGYCVVLVVAGVYGVKCFREFRDFKDSIYLLIPKQGRDRITDPLNMEVEDLPLKVCLQYRNGASFKDIEKNLGLSHPMQAKRELVKGLDILLKSYEENYHEPYLSSRS